MLRRRLRLGGGDRDRIRTGEGRGASGFRLDVEIVVRGQREILIGIVCVHPAVGRFGQGSGEVVDGVVRFLNDGLGLVLVLVPGFALATLNGFKPDRQRVHGLLDRRQRFAGVLPGLIQTLMKAGHGLFDALGRAFFRGADTGFQILLRIGGAGLFQSFDNLGHAFARCFDRLRRAVLGLLYAICQVFPKLGHLFANPPHRNGIVLANLFETRFDVGAIFFVLSFGFGFIQAALKALL